MSEIQKLLDVNIPRDVVSTRSGGGNKQLSYLETWYVIDRMNQVFGTVNWSQEIKSLQLLPGTSKPTYSAIVKITITNKESYTPMIKEGVGYGSDKSDFNSHELAMKEAVSDAFKTAAKNLGRSMGLALYDKTQEYVDEPNKTNEPAKRQETKKLPIPIPVATAIVKTELTTKLLREQIKNTFAVLQAKKAITKEEFVSDFLKGSKTDDLSDETAQVILQNINKKFRKELGLTN